MSAGRRAGLAGAPPRQPGQAPQPPYGPSAASMLVGPYALIWFYRRWLRTHAVAELLAGAGVAIAVALVFATIVAGASVSGSTAQAVHTVTGPASLQLHARGPQGMRERLAVQAQPPPGGRAAVAGAAQPARARGASRARVARGRERWRMRAACQPGRRGKRAGLYGISGAIADMIA